jgi:putative transposase
MRRTYKYRLYPNKAQKQALDFLLWQGRDLYNSALEQCINVYKETGKGIPYYEQWEYFRDQRRASPDTLGKLNATCVQQMLRRLDKAFAAFFRRLKAGEKPGFPRFKGRSRFHSLEFRHGDGCKLRTDRDGRKMFYVQNVGEVKVKYHRPIPGDATIKHVVIKRSLNKWYVCLMLELPDPEPKCSTRRGGTSSGLVVGIDVGLKNLLALSNGETVENPRWLKSSLANLRVAQRRAARRKKGSKRRQKAYAQVARLHEQIANRRRDFWHKLTRKLVDTYRLIAIEDLTLEFMTQNPYLAQSAHDAALGEFWQLLQYKAEEAGTEVVAVNPRNTSQMCSGCGTIVEKSLSIRIHDCPQCSLKLDRDVNAARNILNLATSPPGRGGQGLTWAVAPCVP